jgi:predicted DNA-binding protein (UPF0278 family)
MIYDQMIRNRRPKDSDIRDLHHAVASSITRALVSQDEGLRTWASRVNLPDFQVCDLDTLLKTLSMVGR